jgi:hypothetical protein
MLYATLHPRFIVNSGRPDLEKVLTTLSIATSRRKHQNIARSPYYDSGAFTNSNQLFFVTRRPACKAG